MSEYVYCHVCILISTEGVPLYMQVGEKGWSLVNEYLDSGKNPYEVFKPGLRLK